MGHARGHKGAAAARLWQPAISAVCKACIRREGFERQKQPAVQANASEPGGGDDGSVGTHDQATGVGVNLALHPACQATMVPATARCLGGLSPCGLHAPASAFSRTPPCI